MKTRTLIVFSYELEQQCRYSEIALGDMSAALQEMDRLANEHRVASETEDFARVFALMDERKRDAPEARVWYAAQSYLVCIGNISKVFWPSGGPERERHRILRRLFRIEGTSVFAPGRFTMRYLRNHFEHFDERIDQYVEGTDANIADLSLGSVTPVVGPGTSLRGFNPRTLTISFAGEVYQLDEAIRQTRTLAARAKELVDPLAYWEIGPERIENPLNGAWIERSAFDQVYAELFPSYPSESMKLNLVGLYQHRVIDATAQADNGQCAHCGTTLTQQGNGRWCDQCRVWLPETMFG